MKGMKLLVLAIALLGLSTQAHSDVYIGGGAYLADVDDSFNANDVSDDDIVPAIFVGYKPWSFFAIEGGYYDLGDFSDTVNGTKVTADLDAFTLGVNAILPLMFIDLYAKTGLAYVGYDFEAGNYKKDGTTNDLYYGVGGNINITKWIDLYVEYTVFDTEVEVEMLGVGARLEF